MWYPVTALHQEHFFGTLHCRTNWLLAYLEGLDKSGSWYTGIRTAGTSPSKNQDCKTIRQRNVSKNVSSFGGAQPHAKSLSSNPSAALEQLDVMSREWVSRPQPRKKANQGRSSESQERNQFLGITHEAFPSRLTWWDGPCVQLQELQCDTSHALLGHPLPDPFLFLTLNNKLKPEIIMINKDWRAMLEAAEGHGAVHTKCWSQMMEKLRALIRDSTLTGISLDETNLTAAPDLWNGVMIQLNSSGQLDIELVWEIVGSFTRSSSVWICSTLSVGWCQNLKGMMSKQQWHWRFGLSGRGWFIDVGQGKLINPNTSIRASRHAVFGSNVYLVFGCMSDLVMNFAELPFHSSQLKFIGYIKEVAKSFDFKLVPIKVNFSERNILSQPWVDIGDTQILLLENELPAGSFWEDVHIISCTFAAIILIDLSKFQPIRCMAHVESLRCKELLSNLSQANTDPE
ncbi:hypothetical protein BT96DRAFT_945552 [Gymnopus androsaceus JB14]|uniref:Uncharacterized protein n=1 Tax=Gymnopus androsaceus JB14 TaxID=1447944 RepID=A0A6A4H0N4_9AGAR|nr:hypothetical protein BT96DRAFT_945552 [Gymnopus androsaceus JB14]